MWEEEDMLKPQHIRSERDWRSSSDFFRWEDIHIAAPNSYVFISQPKVRSLHRARKVFLKFCWQKTIPFSKIWPLFYWNRREAHSPISSVRIPSELFRGNWGLTKSDLYLCICTACVVFKQNSLLWWTCIMERLVVWNLHHLEFEPTTQTALAARLISQSSFDLVS